MVILAEIIIIVFWMAMFNEVEPFSSFASWAILIVPLVILWFIARYEKGANSILLLGTYLIGRKEIPEGYITTKWIMFFFVPVIPVRSLVITRDSPDKTVDMGFGRSSSYNYESYNLQGLGLYFPHVLLIWGIEAVIILILVLIVLL